MDNFLVSALKGAIPRLNIKVFYRTSNHAVLIHMRTALTPYLLLVWLKFKGRVAWRLLQLTRLAQTVLMGRKNQWAMPCPQPPDNRKPLLFNFNARAGQQRD